MTEAEARTILGDTVRPNNSLFHLGHYTAWPAWDTDTICLDDHFKLNELEAIVWWMTNTRITDAPDTP